MQRSIASLLPERPAVGRAGPPLGQRDRAIAVALYVSILGLYVAISGSRLLHHSVDNNLAIAAAAALRGQLSISGPPAPGTSDWAELDELSLKDGSRLIGELLHPDGDQIRLRDGRIVRFAKADTVAHAKRYYPAFALFPILFFVPFVAVFGIAINDVLLTVLLAPLAAAMLFLALRRLRADDQSERSERDDLLLVVLFAFGTVYLPASVAGSARYTVQIIATLLTAAFVLCSIRARRPTLAGLCLGAMILTRPHLVAWGALYFFEMYRVRDGRRSLELAAAFLLPAVALSVLGFAFNWHRFHSLLDPGECFLHSPDRLAVKDFGTFSSAFVGRNLSSALVLTPYFQSAPPYVQLSAHGLSLLITTPPYVYLLWPRVRTALHSLLWLVVVPIAAAGFAHYNDGWVQFGYRYSNDFSLALVMLLAIGGRPFNRTWKVLLVCAVLVNLFGAITFGRFWHFYYFDRPFILAGHDL